MRPFFRFCATLGSALFAILVAAPIAVASAVKRDPFDVYSTNDYGGIGLLQTRTARFAPDGQFEVGASFVNPYRRYYLTWQILPWAEVTFRYTDVTNAIFKGSVVPQSQKEFFSDLFSLSGGGTHLDRAFDLKFRLWRESDVRPEVAIGFQDIVGTGAFGSEYVVASKRIGDFDISGGVAWGYLGSRSAFDNPMRLFGGRFRARDTDTGFGGNFLIGNLFSGEKVGVFGGVEYWTPIDGLSLKVEYNGADPETGEPLANSFKESMPINIGVNYRRGRAFDLAVALERGNSLMFRAALRFNLNSKGMPKIDEPPAPILPRNNMVDDPSDETANEVRAAEYRESEETLRAASLEGAAQDFAIRQWRRLPLRERIEAVLESHGFFVRSVALRDGAARALVDAAQWMTKDDHRRAADDIFRASDAELTHLTLSSWLGGLEYAQLTAHNIRLQSVMDDRLAGQSSGASGGESEADAAAKAIFSQLKIVNLKGYAFHLTDTTATLYLAETKFRDSAKTVGRVARIVANNVPPGVEAITVVIMTDYVPTGQVTVIRSDLERGASYESSPEEIWANAALEAPDARRNLPDDAIVNRKSLPNVVYGLQPLLRQHIGNPEEGVYLADVILAANVRVNLLPGLSVRGTYGQFLFGNLDRIDRESDSVLPHVRSDVVHYVQQGRSGVTRLQADYLTNLWRNVYVRVSAGLFEPMYGGVGAEVLYRPFGKRFAIGADVNWVKQRDFNQMFRFRDYDIVTGHLNLYYESSFYNLDGAVHIGRYLAGDHGVTFDISRTFKSGIRVGAFATFTNVSAEEFGEGSFDKGFYMVIPLDVLSFKSSRQSTRFQFRPLTRDGGQRVDIGPKLHDITSSDTQRTLRESWRNILD